MLDELRVEAISLEEQLSSMSDDQLEGQVGVLKVGTIQLSLLIPLQFLYATFSVHLLLCLLLNRIPEYWGDKWGFSSLVPLEMDCSSRNWISS